MRSGFTRRPGPVTALASVRVRVFLCVFCRFVAFRRPSALGRSALGLPSEDGSFLSGGKRSMRMPKTRAERERANSLLQGRLTQASAGCSEQAPDFPPRYNGLFLPGANEHAFRLRKSRESQSDRALAGAWHCRCEPRSGTVVGHSKESSTEIRVLAETCTGSHSIGSPAQPESSTAMRDLT